MRLIPASAFRHVFEPLQGKQIGYVRMPGNVGDQMIELAAFQLMREFGVNCQMYHVNQHCDADEIVIAGGGNMGGLYSLNQRIRSEILQLGRPVTVLPQTFTSPEPFSYQRVFVRERASLRFRPDAVLAPDLALGLEYESTYRSSEKIGVWLRKDAESGFHSVASHGDPAFACSTPVEYLKLAARYEHIVTDRLHFAIAGLLNRRRVTLLPNNYFKNRSMYDTWLRDLGCEWADRVEVTFTLKSGNNHVWQEHPSS